MQQDELLLREWSKANGINPPLKSRDDLPHGTNPPLQKQAPARAGAFDPPFVLLINISEERGRRTYS
ncbi:hypothetical protein [Bradyrhizobium sp. 187]|uniref:hypothetical protein n=1 Tax=Bradyrhizobium sp. 187 TaxID=2782655 RepID=UPI0020002BD8|nr:hypothetical protein [Bradyrhizobium sp. 187]UPJ77016.1 hypothetical protein IVB19_37120 [Bradyrhizobium sp. 187]